MTFSVSALKKLLDYDPDSGLLTWSDCKENWAHCSKRMPGTAAGTLSDRGCIRVCINGERYAATRIIWAIQTGEWPKHQVDHDNRIRSDNRWENLKEATNRENCRNKRGARRHHNVRFRGGKYSVFIREKGKQVSHGSYSSLEDAIAVRDRELCRLSEEES